MALAADAEWHTPDRAAAAILYIVGAGRWRGHTARDALTLVVLLLREGCTSRPRLAI